jgi:hypothetical protein
VVVNWDVGPLNEVSLIVNRIVCATVPVFSITVPELETVLSPPGPGDFIEV